MDIETYITCRDIKYFLSHYGLNYDKETLQIILDHSRIRKDDLDEDTIVNYLSWYVIFSGDNRLITIICDRLDESKRLLARIENNIKSIDGIKYIKNKTKLKIHTNTILCITKTNNACKGMSVDLCLLMGDTTGNILERIYPSLCTSKGKLIVGNYYENS